MRRLRAIVHRVWWTRITITVVTVIDGEPMEHPIGFYPTHLVTGAAAVVGSAWVLAALI